MRLCFVEEVHVAFEHGANESTQRQRARHAVDGGHAAARGRVASYIGDGCDEVVDEALGNARLCVSQGDADVDGGWFVEAVQVPGLCGHAIKDAIDVECGGVEGDHPERVAQDAQIGDGGDVVADGGGGFEDALRCVGVALFADGDHGGPACGAECARSAACEGGGEVESPWPVGGGVVLVVTQFWVAIEDDRGAFCGVAVFVRVGGDGGDAGEGEVEGGDGVPKFFCPGEDEATKTSIGVEADACGAGDF